MPVNSEPEPLAPHEPALDRAQARLRLAPDVLVRLGVGAVLPALEHREQQRLHARVRRLASVRIAARRRSRSSPLSSIVAAATLERRLDGRIGLLLERLPDERQHALVGAAGERLGRGEPRLALRRNEPKRRERGRDRAAHAVVDDDVLAVRGQRRDGRAGQRVGPALALDDEDALPGDLQLALAERREHRRSPAGRPRRRARRSPRASRRRRRSRASRRRPVERPAPASQRGEQRESRDEQGSDAHIGKGRWPRPPSRCLGRAPVTSSRPRPARPSSCRCRR